MKYKSLVIALLLPLAWILSLQLVFSLPFSVAEDFKWFISGIVGTLIALLVTYVFSRIDNYPFDQIGLRWDSNTLKRATKGFLIGASISLVMLGIIVSFSDLKVSWNQEANVPLALYWVLAFIPLALMEEVAFRGFAFIRLNQLLGLRLTLVITSVLFAYYHDVTGSSFFYQLLGPGIWGIIYGITAIWSDGIAVPTGIHVAANVIQALFGMKESKYAIWMIDYDVEVTEAMLTQTNNVGLICQVLLLVVGVVLTEWYIRNRKDKNDNVHYV